VRRTHWLSSWLRIVRVDLRLLNPPLILDLAAQLVELCH
jgi:hypothetical protein